MPPRPPRPPASPLPPLPPGSPGHYLLRKGWKRSAKGWTNHALDQDTPVSMTVAVGIQQENDNENP